MNANTPKVIKLTPPSFQNISFHHKTGDMLQKTGNVKRTYVCLRPKRSNLPKIETELLDSKLIVHNYGHGGSGWTLLFGTVQKSLQLFVKAASVNLLPCDTKITIIGAGCIGLTTALYLHEKGFNNIEIIAEKLNDTPSYNAGGMYGIASLNLGDEIMKKDCEHFALETYRRLAKIAEGKDPLFDKGVMKIDAYTGNDEEQGILPDPLGLDVLIDNEIIPPGEEVIVDFGKRKVKMLKYKTFFIYTTMFMMELLRLCKERQVKITEKKVESFNEIESSVIFNCAGLGAKELIKDAELHPVCGHMLELQNQPKIEETNYIMAIKIASKPVKTPEEYEDLPFFYYMPKGEGVIGGTFCIDYDGRDKEFNEKEFKGLIERARILFGNFEPKPCL